MEWVGAHCKHQVGLVEGNHRIPTKPGDLTRKRLPEDREAEVNVRVDVFLLLNELWHGSALPLERIVDPGTEDAQRNHTVSIEQLIEQSGPTKRIADYDEIHGTVSSRSVIS